MFTDSLGSSGHLSMSNSEILKLEKFKENQQIRVEVKSTERHLCFNIFF